MLTRKEYICKFFLTKAKKPLRTKRQKGTHEQNMGFAKIEPPHP
jgi:hypothetical protein